MTIWIPKLVSATLLALTALFCLLSGRATAQVPPLWPANSVIYTVYPAIFSPGGNFAGVTAQLPRLRNLGVSVLWLMPVTPIGQPVGSHPAFGSPYCVHDFFAVNSDYGTEDDLKTLVSTAHKLGLKVILDEVLNHTAWDNALTTQHPDWYVHTDGNPKNPASIQQAFTYPDVAQLNYANPDLRAYMVGMLQFWRVQYGVDGFRFDTASNPDGPGRMIPADFWLDLGQQLRTSKPDILLLGECQSVDLALKPFPLDYGWSMYDALKAAFNGGDATTRVQGSWQYEQNAFPAGMQHMAIQDDWDTNRDVSAYNGAAGAQAAAVFHFTSVGIPLLYNGMEIGNAGGANNPHTPIDWTNADPRFAGFYQRLVALRRKTPALQTGDMAWITNSVPSQVLTYTRTGGGQQFLIEINCSGAAASGTVTVPAEPQWTQVSITGVLPKTLHAVPSEISLQPKEFVVYKRSL